MLEIPVYEIAVMAIFLALFCKQDMLQTSIDKLFGSSLMAINMQQIQGQSVPLLGS